MKRRSTRFVVCARMGDPLFLAGRARLIWAAQTAQAMAELTDSCLLVGSGQHLPFKVESVDGTKSLSRVVATMYNVAGDFEMMPLYGPRVDQQNPLPYGKVEADELFSGRSSCIDGRQSIEDHHSG